MHAFTGGCALDEKEVLVIFLFVHLQAKVKKPRWNGSTKN